MFTLSSVMSLWSSLVAVINVHREEITAEMLQEIPPMLERVEELVVRAQKEQYELQDIWPKMVTKGTT